MRKLIPLVLILLCICIGPARAGEMRQIELSDGSTLSGEVLSYQNGTYTVRTVALGTITIPDSRVRSISSSGSAAAHGGTGGQVNALQQQMLSDDQVMQIIMSLKDDPSFRQALDDPEIMRAVEANDLAALMGNPRFLQLLSNPKVLEINKKVAE